ncbi:MAG: aminoacyl-tRNA hydrolase [Acidimicrobiia bacterium]
MLLIVGLRNPGSDYQGTRHNVGEEVVGILAARAGAKFRRAPRRIRAGIAAVELGGRPALLALPRTFMNDSGRAVAPLLRRYEIEPEQLALVHDDIDLPFGKLRFHFGRGPGGHNGVESVMKAVGSRHTWRLKFGVGRPPGRMDPADFVLRSFDDRERADVDLLIELAADVLETFAAHGGEAARRRAGEAAARLGDDPP